MIQVVMCDPGKEYFSTYYLSTTIKTNNNVINIATMDGIIEDSSSIGVARVASDLPKFDKKRSLLVGSLSIFM